MGSPSFPASQARPTLKIAFLLLAAACSRDKGKQEDRTDPTVAPAQLSLRVTIAGTPSTWGADVFAAVPHHVSANNSGDGRDTWSLRDLVRKQVGPTARVVSVSGSDGTKPIDAAAWNDTAQTPVIHTTRRGTLKFRFEDAAGKWGQSLVSDVSALEIVP